MDGGGIGNVEFVVSDNVLVWGIDWCNIYLFVCIFIFGVELKF